MTDHAAGSGAAAAPAGTRTAGMDGGLGSAVDWLLEEERSERIARRALAVAVLVYCAWAVWLTRGSSFTFEEWIYVGESDGLTPDSILAPFGGHLIALTRLIFEASLGLFGPTHVPFQLLVIALAASTAVLLFVLVRRRVGPLAALAAAILLLFLGSTPEVLHGWVTMWVQASCAGLGAFLALDQRSRRGDALACVLLILAVLAFSVGVAFAIGAAAWLLTARRGRQIWVAGVPLILYGIWWLWALKFEEDSQAAHNFLLSPVWAADSLAAAAAALTGLSIDLSSEPDLQSIPLGWGRVVAAAAVVLALRGVRRHGASPLLWGATVLLCALWFGEALSHSLAGLTRRTPDLDRYAYPAAIGLVLVLAASFQGWRPSRRALVTMFALVGLALPANLWLMNERGKSIRAESDLARARAGALELGRDIVPDAFVFPFDPANACSRLVCGGIIPPSAGAYLGAVDRFGTFGDGIEEFANASEEQRQVADRSLGSIAAPKATAVDVGNLRCGRPASEVPLPPGGAIVRAGSDGPLTLRRFAATPTVTAGRLRAGQPATLVLPVDAAARPWIASVRSGDLEICG